MDVDESERCEKCRKPLMPGDYVKFTNARIPGAYRYWHSECFDESCTPWSKWSHVGLAIKRSK
jgi:hypothetical protein